MKPLIVVQARLESTRFPKKSMADLCGAPMYYRVLQRARQLGDDVLLANPEWWGNPPLTRFFNVVSAYSEVDPATGLPEFDPIIRITGDCPLADVGVWRQAMGSYDPTYDIQYTPAAMDGLDIEIFSRRAVIAAFYAQPSTYQKEHVTPWMRQNLKNKEFAIEGVYRWSIDDFDSLGWARDVYGTCVLCARGVPHHTNARSSIGGTEGRSPMWDLHVSTGGGLEECPAYDLLKSRMGGEVYRSA